MIRNFALIAIMALIGVATTGSASAQTIRPSSADVAPSSGRSCPEYGLSSHGSAVVCMSGAQIVKALAFNQENAACSEDDALMFADPDYDPSAARAGRMVCHNLGDLMADNVNGAVKACAFNGQMLAGVDVATNRPICAPWGTRIAP